MSEFKNLLENEDYKSIEILASLTLDQDPIHFYFYAEALYQSKQYKRAIVKFTHKRDAIYEKISNCYFHLNEINISIQNLEQIQEKTPKHYLLLGNLNKRKGASKTAINYYLEYLKYNPNSLYVIEELFKLGELDIEIETSDENVLKYILSKKFIYKFEYKKALEVIKDLETLEFLLMKAECEFKLYKFNDSINTFDSIKSIDLNVVKNMDIYGFLLKKKNRFQDLNNLCLKLIDNHPNSSECWSCMAINFERQNQFESAIKAIEKAITIQPDSVFAYFIKGTLLLDQKLYEEAISVFKNMHSISKDLIITCGLIQSLLFFNKEKEALIEVNLLSKLYPNHIVTNLMMGNVFFKNRKFKNARESYEKVKQMFENEDDVLDEAVLGNVDIEISEENYDGAIKMIKKALDIRKVDKFYVKLGNIYLLMKIFDESLKYYNMALGINQNCEDAKSGIAILESKLNQPIGEDGNSFIEQ